MLKLSLILMTVLRLYYYPCIEDKETKSERLSNLPRSHRVEQLVFRHNSSFKRPPSPSEHTPQREKWKLEKLFSPNIYLLSLPDSSCPGECSGSGEASTVLPQGKREVSH